jgi:hypothetical protein
MKPVVVFLALTILLLSGCGRRSLQEELVQYRQTVLATVATTEDRLQSMLAELEASDPSPVAAEQSLEFLVDRFLPSCREILSCLAARPPSTPELRACHTELVDFYRDAAGFASACASAIRRGDADTASVAMERMKALDISPVQSRLQTLYASHGVPLD